MFGFTARAISRLLPTARTWNCISSKGEFIREGFAREKDWIRCTLGPEKFYVLSGIADALPVTVNTGTARDIAKPWHESHGDATHQGNKTSLHQCGFFSSSTATRHQLARHNANSPHSLPARRTRGHKISDSRPTSHAPPHHKPQQALSQHHPPTDRKSVV